MRSVLWKQSGRREGGGNGEGGPGGLVKKTLGYGMIATNILHIERITYKQLLAMSKRALTNSQQVGYRLL